MSKHLDEQALRRQCLLIRELAPTLTLTLALPSHQRAGPNPYPRSHPYSHLRRHAGKNCGKAPFIIELTKRFVRGDVPDIAALSDREAAQLLMGIRGIGDWVG